MKETVVGRSVFQCLKEEKTTKNTHLESPHTWKGPASYECYAHESWPCEINREE